MLSIAKLSAGQEDYFLEFEHERVDALADGTTAHCAGPPEAPGRWAGAGAARLGLAGAAQPDDLRRLFAGGHPAAAAETRPTASARVAAFDLTFSAPKSVSVLFGLADDSVQGAVRHSHDRAVVEALGCLERNAAAVRRGRGGAVVLPASGLVTAVFRHRTSRAGDPQLHSHVVVANIGYGADGRWTALDGRRLYQHATAASRVYQAVLRGELTRTLGVEWAPVCDGIAELKGVPADVRRLFSRRRAEIVAELTEQGVTGPRASELAALSTRRAKRPLGEPGELRAGWRRRACEPGCHAADLDGLLGRTAPLARIEADVERLIGELLGADGLTHRAVELRPPQRHHGVVRTAAGRYDRGRRCARAACRPGAAVSRGRRLGRRGRRTRGGRVVAPA